MSQTKLDNTGKTVFDDIYQSPDPRAYCREMQRLDYVVPAEAKPFFHSLIDNYRQHHPDRRDKSLIILDLGCSYGINGALLRLDIPLQDLYQHYQDRDQLSPDQLILEDKNTFQQRSQERNLQIVGLDISQPALDYAESTGMLQESICVNLETDQLNDHEANLLGQVDCIISTGCIGYITTTTLEKVLQACKTKKPWMAHCVLRMFALDEYLQLFQYYGYSIEMESEPVRQRKFASLAEQQQVKERLDQMGINRRGYEDQGSLYANVIQCTTDLT